MFHCIAGKAGVVFSAREPLLLRRRHDLAIADKRGSRIVKESGYTEDVL
jgi:hypothetical protein